LQQLDLRRIARHQRITAAKVLLLLQTHAQRKFFRQVRGCR
jgi:hypothetical protein